MSSEPSAPPSTPLMRQYHGIKQQVPNTLLMFRLGDFYELFYDDAVTAARELEITLTSRNKEKGQAIPMCGVPYHAADGYIAKLIQKGYKVAICDQMEDPRQAKKLVRREVTRVVTPGTASDSHTLSPRDNNFLAAACRSVDRVGLASVDLSTGEFRSTEFAGEGREAKLAEELSHLGARELLYSETNSAITGSGGRLALGDSDAVPFGGSHRITRTPLEDWVFGYDYAYRLL